MSIFLDTLADLMTTGRAQMGLPLRYGRRPRPPDRPDPALELIDRKLVQRADTPDDRLIIRPPQEVKSQRCSRRFRIELSMVTPATRMRDLMPTQKLDTRIAIASFETPPPAGGAAPSATTSAQTPAS